MSFLEEVVGRVTGSRRGLGWRVGWTQQIRAEHQRAGLQTSEEGWRFGLNPPGKELIGNLTQAPNVKEDV